MNAKRIVALGLGGGAIAAWLAAASTPVRPPNADSIVRTSTAVEMRGAELSAEIARLRDRLHPTVAPQAPSRNLFKFSSRSPRARDVAPVAPPPAAAPIAAPMVMRPSLKLVGIAEDAGPDGAALRTAIISSPSGQLYFAKPGDRMIDRFQIVRISGEAAEITDLDDNSTFTLVLR